MPQPYSSDLRQRVLHALEKSPLTRNEIAAQFEISPATLYNWQKQRKQDGRTTAKPHAGGRASRFNPAVLHWLVKEQNDRTLAELQAAYEANTGIPISYSSVRNVLALLGLTRKKKDAPGQRASST